MKQSISQWLSSRQGKFVRGLPFHWGGGEIILAAILILGILSLGSGMVGKWIDSAGDSGILPVTLHSLSEADYSVDEIVRSVPAIGLDIIRDLLGIDKPPETGGAPEIAVIVPATLTPTPTNVFSGNIPPIGTETSEIPEDPTATEKPLSTQTSSPQQTSTPTNLPISSATDTATSTSFSPKPTNTPIPTATQGKIVTNTPFPTQPAPTAIPTQLPTNTQLPPPTNTPLPPPTNTPKPPPTPLPDSSPTPRPTRSSTLAVTPTAKYTPGVTGEPPVAP